MARDAMNTQAALAAETVGERAIYLAINEILWHDWDPIGVNNITPRDEYENYTPEIFRLKMSGARTEEIANKLLELEQNTIGMGGGREHCLRVAEKIINLS